MDHDQPDHWIDLLPRFPYVVLEEVRAHEGGTACRGSLSRRVGRDPLAASGRCQAVILAAGRGSRLNENTRDVPKCLQVVGGTTLLERQIRILRAAGVEEICVVAGYKAELVREAVGDSVHIIENPRYAQTNSLYSFWLCRDWVRASLLVLNCDVFAARQILERVLETPGSAFAYDSSSGDDAEHMKVDVSKGYLQVMRKDLPDCLTGGENVGILFFEAPAARRLFEEAESTLAAGGEKMWLAAAVERLATYVPLRGADVHGHPWVEIDFPEDLERARREVWPQMALSGTLGL